MKSRAAEPGSKFDYKTKSKNKSKKGGSAKGTRVGKTKKASSPRGRARRQATGGVGRAGAAKGSQMRRTGIVTSFVRDAASGRILILRRSKKVRSMRGKWSGISGVIEGREKPLARARIEIYEEASIRAPSLRLVSRADVLRITSPQYRNHEWMVHPFLFEVDAAPKVRLNWENSEYRWVRMGEVGRYDTVPDLCRVLLCLL